MSRIFSPRNILIIVALLAVIVGSRLLFPVALPAILLAPEAIPGLRIGGFPITNTMIATLLADLTVIILGWLAVKDRAMVPGRWQNAVEFIFEFFQNLGGDVVGPQVARRMMPLVMTVFALILASNWWGRIPGVEAIGIIETPHQEGVQLWRTARVLPGVYTITAQPGNPAVATEAYIKAKEAEHAANPNDHSVPEQGALLPFLRTATTDLNFPIALALIAFVYIQYWGFRSNGLGYLGKFFTLKGVIPAFVGLLEFISEIAKIISFSFRLFGNVFAGTVLVFVMSFLLPWLVPIPFMGLEIFVGLIQALVFALLIIIFSGTAMEKHEEHEHVGEHGESGPAKLATQLEEQAHA